MPENIYELVVKPTEINFAPKTQAEEILQNVMTICSTAKYSVPMDREFGIDGNILDQPVISARAKYTQEIVKAVREFEPRARISRVDFQAVDDGKIYPKIYVKLTGD